VGGFGAYAGADGSSSRGYFNRLGQLHGPGIHTAPGATTHITAGEFREGALWGRGLEVNSRLGR
jgi:hypothetical protein